MYKHIGLLASAAIFSTGALAQSSLPTEPQPSSPGTQQQYPDLPVYPEQPPSYPAQGPSYPGDSSGGSSGGYRAPTESGGQPDSSAIQFDAHPRGGMEDSRPIPAAPPPMAVMTPVTENDITYLCGGIGSDEAAQMKQAARDYDLMLTFAARNGSYLADVNVDIADARGQSLLKTTCDGPMMLVDLPRSGSYKIRAETGGHAVTRTARIQSRDRGKAVAMVWPRAAVGLDQDR